MSDAGELLVRHKLTVADIYRMLDAGILHEDDRVELIDGELLDMAPTGADHATTADLQRRVLEAHRTPVDGAYADTAQYKPGGRVSPALLPEAVLTLAGIFD